MKKIIYCMLLIPSISFGMYWATEMDRPFTGTGMPIITQVYRPPINPLRRTPEEVCCAKNEECDTCGTCAISRKDIIKNARSGRSHKRNGYCSSSCPGVA